MTEIFQFKPKSTLVATENLEAFIAKCRDELTVFGSDLKWGEPVWPNITVFLITHDPQPASRADMASEGLPRLHA
ncbi:MULTISPECIES: hypothetical protein, partial [unclassified Aeromonas]|uniref:hypothetical protein n=1 Tax=unclassified Aeromonas TaxID=257493 RepID=UPI0022E6E468